jgi:hypothetical protein
LLCVFIKFYGHKANSPPISLIFDGSLYSTPNRETTAAPPNPMVRALCKPIGSSGAMSW